MTYVFLGAFTVWLMMVIAGKEAFPGIGLRTVIVASTLLSLLNVLLIVGVLFGIFGWLPGGFVSAFIASYFATIISSTIGVIVLYAHSLIRGRKAA